MAIFGPEIAIDERSVRTVFYEGRCPPAEKFRKGELQFYKTKINIQTELRELISNPDKMHLC